MTLAGPAPFEGFEPGLELPASKRAAYFNTCYLNNPNELDDWRVSPLHAPSLMGMPPALIITAGKDPLKSGAERYAERLVLAGCSVQYTCYEECGHGFTVMPGLGSEKDIENAWTQMCAFLSEFFK
jgi:acetyl esterase